MSCRCRNLQPRQMRAQQRVLKLEHLNIIDCLCCLVDACELHHAHITTIFENPRKCSVRVCRESGYSLCAPWHLLSWIQPLPLQKLLAVLASVSASHEATTVQNQSIVSTGLNLVVPRFPGRSTRNYSDSRVCSALLM